MDTPLAFEPPLPAYKNRKAGLVIFGILTILLGVICLLFAGLMLVTPLLLKNVPHAEQTTDLRSVIMAVGMYGLLGIANIWLGIGSIMARRWARALLLICSWTWLACGIITMIGAAVLFPKFMATVSAQQQASPAVSPEFYNGLMLGMLVFIGIIFVLLPLLWVIFYRGKNVKATCEALDLIPRWTDRCPLPVLAASLMTFCGGLSMLFMPLSMNGAIAFFGTILAGISGSICYVLFALICLFASRSLYRLELRGWWITLAGISLWTISQVLTFSHQNVADFYALAMPHMPEAQKAQSLQFMNSGFMIWCAVLWFIPFSAYLLYIRKFFPAKSA